MVGGPLGFSLASYVRSSRTLTGWLTPFAKWYAGVSGYRRIGLRYDDLLVEENDEVQKALTRLTPREYYDRQYRMRLASQASVLHKDLPKEQWVKEEDDIRYLKPYVEEACKETEERRVWDTMTVSRK